jgi:hypothetical protein
MVSSSASLSGVTNSSGNLQLSVAVPLGPGLVGASITIQAAALVPNGPVAIGMPGDGLVLTQAIHITVGY